MHFTLRLWVILFTSSLFLLTSFIVIPSSHAQSNQCPNAPQSRLMRGDEATITAPSSVNIRRTPGTNAPRTGMIPYDARVQVLQGPYCQGDYAWWQVDYEGTVGWVAEGTPDSYHLAPYRVITTRTDLLRVIVPPELAENVTTRTVTDPAYLPQISDQLPAPDVVCAPSDSDATDAISDAQPCQAPDLPEATHFVLDGYPIASEQPPIIQVLPVFDDAPPPYIERLRVTLKYKPQFETLDDPVLPAGYTSARLMYLSFADGTGVRGIVIPAWPTMADPVDVRQLGLYYAYVGRSERAFVSALLPLDDTFLQENAPNLDDYLQPVAVNAAEQDIPPTDLETNTDVADNETDDATGEQSTREEQYAAYLADVAELVERQPADAFGVDLMLLDEMMRQLSSAPEATQEQVAQYGTQTFTYEQSVEITYPVALASSTTSRVVPESAQLPAHLQVDFVDYPVSNGVMPRMRIFSLPALGIQMESLTPLGQVRDMIDAQEDIYASIPIAEFDVPLFQSQSKVLLFENGTGVRFVGIISEDVEVLANAPLFYTFVGMNFDQTLIIFLRVPLAMPPVGRQALDFAPGDDYAIRFDAALDSVREDEYTPELSTLDAMIESLRLGAPD